MQKKIILLTAIFLFFFQCIFSQTTTGSIDGVVTDENGKYFSGVLVKLSGNYLQGVRVFVTGGEGKFRFISIPVGDYQIILVHDGMNKVILKNIRVKLGRNTSLGMIIVSTTSMQTHEIGVEGRHPLIDYLDSSSSGNISNEQIKTLPVDRDYKSLITVYPGINESFYGDLPNISGATGAENVFYINSINVTDPIGTGGGMNLPFNFIKEIEIKPSGYQAEFGRTMGGIINVITHSGSNKLQGNVFGFFTNTDMMGTQKIGVLDLSVAAATNYDIGFSLGGPILKNKLWYFIAYNRNYENTEILFPDIGVYPETRTQNMFAFKLDWKPFKRAEISFTLLGDPEDYLGIRSTHPVSGSVKSIINADPILGRLKTGGISFAVNSKIYFNDDLLMEIYSSYYKNKGYTSGRSSETEKEPLFINLLTGEWNGGYGEKRNQSGIRISLGLKNTFFLSNHIIKYGIEYEENQFEEFWKLNDPGLCVKLGEDLFMAITMNRNFSVVNKIPTIFFQDSWNISHRLRIHIGLRWESQYIYGADGRLAQQILDMWQPRIGLIFRIGKNHTGKLFGSAGRYYHLYQGYVGQHYLGDYQENDMNMYTTDPRIQGSIPFDTPFSLSGTYFDKIKNLKGHYFDEFNLGYSTNITKNVKVSMAAKLRSIREVFGIGLINGMEIVGNWGDGDLSFLPDPKRDYSSIEFIYEKMNSGNFNYIISFTISKSYGNYGGFFVQDNPFLGMLMYMSLQTENQVENSTGLLPNDRTHTLKFYGDFKLNKYFNAGIFFTIMSGTPLNIFWDNDAVHPARWKCYIPRGTAGRTPMIWDLNLRLAWTLDIFKNPEYGIKIYLDMLHIRNWESAQPLLFDQLKYIGEEVGDDGIPLSISPGYDQVLKYQDPMKIRLGLEFSFGEN